MNSCLSSLNSNNGYGYIYDSTEECSRVVENLLGFTLHGMMNKIMMVENNIVSTRVPLYGYDSAGSLNFSDPDLLQFINSKSDGSDQLQHPTVTTGNLIPNFSPHADDNNNINTNIVECKKRLPSASFKKVKKVVHWSRNEHM